MLIRDGNKIINLRDIRAIKTDAPALPPEKEQQLHLIDLAAKGSIEAAADLAEGYWKGVFGESPNKEKAQKWAKYAAKHGNEKARQLLSKLEGNN